MLYCLQVFLLAMVFAYIPVLKHGLESTVMTGLQIGALVKWILTTPVQVTSLCCRQYSLAAADFVCFSFALTAF